MSVRPKLLSPTCLLEGIIARETASGGPADSKHNSRTHRGRPLTNLVFFILLAEQFRQRRQLTVRLLIRFFLHHKANCSTSSSCQLSAASFG